MFAGFSAVREKFGRRNREPIGLSSTALGHDPVRRPSSARPQRKAAPAASFTRLLRIASLAPDIQEAILQGRQPKGLQLEELAKGMPSIW